MKVAYNCRPIHVLHMVSYSSFTGSKCLFFAKLADARAIADWLGASDLHVTQTRWIAPSWD